jgi:hypothetical protein
MTTPDPRRDEKASTSPSDEREYLLMTKVIVTAAVTRWRPAT